MKSPGSGPTSPSATFSPVRVTESPITAQKGQLRGTPRTVRDAAADLFNIIQEWNKSHITGMDVIQGIVDKKLEQLNKTNLAKCEYPEGLQEDCDKLEDICSRLNSIVNKMEQLIKNFNAIQKLEEMSRTGRRPIFTTWTAEKYVVAAKSIYEAYIMEIKVKFYIKENIGHTSSKENLMVYCSLWAHQPYVNNALDFHLESMLKETGHR